MPLRILHCIPSLLGGGAEKQLCYLARGLVALGHEVHVAYQIDGPNLPLLRESGATVHRLAARPLYDPRVATDIAAVVRRERVHVVQTWLRRMDLWGGFAARAVRVPWIYSERSKAIPADDPVASARALRVLVRAAQGVVANSETAAAGWRDTLGGRVPVRVVPNALPFERIAAAAPADRRELGLPEGVPLVLYAGRFSPEKNVMLLAEALAGVMRERPDVHALLLGEGPELGPLREWVRARGLSRRVVTPGYRDDLYRWMKAATMLVSPARFEGRPNVVTEAMACGSPLVLSDIPQHTEFVGADEAAWMRDGDAGSLRDGIARVLDDPGAALARAERARRAVGRYSVDEMARTYEAIYREVLSDV